MRRNSLPYEEELLLPIIPIRVCLGKIRKQMRVMNTEARHNEALGRSPLCNEFKVSVHGRDRGNPKIPRITADGYRSAKASASIVGKALGVSLPLFTQECHEDENIEEYKKMFPCACHRDDSQGLCPIIGSIEQTGPTSTGTGVRRWLIAR